ncbi:MAG: hypothetical protein ACYC3O_05560 [Burkholderiales bacterium]
MRFLAFLTAIVTVVSLLTAGCATPVGVIPPSAYNPTTDARIRVYSVPDHYIWLFPNQTCAQIVDPSHRGIWFLGISTGLDHFLRTKHIGMPEAANDYDAKYNEFVIKAGEPLTLKAQYVEVLTEDPLNHAIFSGGATCGPRFATLIPEPGHDYEVYSDTYWPERGMNDCNLHVRELKQVAGEVTAVPIGQASGAFQCDAVKK